MVNGCRCNPPNLLQPYSLLAEQRRVMSTEFSDLSSLQSFKVDSQDKKEIFLLKYISALFCIHPSPSHPLKVRWIMFNGGTKIIHFHLYKTLLHPSTSAHLYTVTNKAVLKFCIHQPFLVLPNYGITFEKIENSICLSSSSKEITILSKTSNQNLKIQMSINFCSVPSPTRINLLE
jgi:hypothetical protein